MEDGSTLVGANGMTAKDDFSEYTFYNNSGDFNSKRISENKNKFFTMKTLAIGLMSEQVSTGWISALLNLTGRTNGLSAS